MRATYVVAPLLLIVLAAISCGWNELGGTPPGAAHHPSI